MRTNLENFEENSKIETLVFRLYGLKKTPSGESTEPYHLKEIHGDRSTSDGYLYYKESDTLLSPRGHKNQIKYSYYLRVLTT